MDRHPSTRAQAAARAAADDDLDPDKVLGIVPDKVENNGGRKKGPGPDSAMRLALDFRNALALDPGVWGPDPVNVRALAGSFSRWKREGVTTSDVSRAIMLYASVPGLRNPALPPWRDFLSQRNNLLDKVRRLAPAVPLDTESWTAAPDRTDADTEPWI